MYAVIFEVTPHPEHWDEYLETATALRAQLEQVDGFISVERFASLTEDGKYVSLSFWRDEDAVRAWRENLDHANAQARGKAALFKDYRIRVAQVVRDYGMTD